MSDTEDVKYFSPTCGHCNHNYNQSRNKPYCIYPCNDTFCYICLNKEDVQFCFDCKGIIDEIRPNFGVLQFLLRTDYDNLFDEVKKVLNENGQLNKNILNSYTKYLKESDGNCSTIKSDIESKTEALICTIQDQTKKIINRINDVDYAFKNNLTEMMSGKYVIDKDIDKGIKTLNRPEFLEQIELSLLKEDFNTTKEKLTVICHQMENANSNMTSNLNKIVQAFTKSEDKINNAFNNESTSYLKKCVVPSNKKKDEEIIINDLFPVRTTRFRFVNYKELDSSESEEEKVIKSKRVKEPHVVQFNETTEASTSISKRSLYFKGKNLLDIKGQTPNIYGVNVAKFLWEFSELQTYRIVDPEETDRKCLRNHSRYKPIMTGKENFEKLWLLKDAFKIKFNIKPNDWITKWRKLCQAISHYSINKK